MQTKRVFSAFLTAVLLLSVMPFAVGAAESDISDFRLGMWRTGWYLYDYCGDGGDVVIPSEYDGQPIVLISANAFSGCDTITSITIPASVTDIDDYAFRGCSALTDIYCEAEAQPDGWYDLWASGCSANIWFDGVKLDRAEFDYKIVDGEATVVGYNGMDGDVVIPSEIDGYPVTSIEDRVFYGCTNLKTVELPDSLTSIGQYAFGWCESLTSIAIPAGVASMGYLAFAHCDALENVLCQAESMPEGWDEGWIEHCDASVYWGCTDDFEIPYDPAGEDYKYKVTAKGSVTIKSYIGSGGDVVIPETILGYPVTTIADGAFFECAALTSVVIPDTVTSIGEGAFYDCVALREITIPDSVCEIGSAAFFKCDSLTEITIPASVEYMGVGVFVHSDHLQNIYCEAQSQPEGWDKFWFGSCDATIWFDGVKYEPEHQFLYEIIDGKVTITGYYGDGVNVAIPSELEGYPVVYIGNSAFYGNDSIWSVTIPDSVKVIDDLAFYACYALYEITLSDGLLSVGLGAFGYCNSLLEITIPVSVEYMANNVFISSYNLQNIYCKAGSQPEGWHSDWVGVGNNATVHWNTCMHIDTDKTEHTVAPTCTQDGGTYLRCEDCGEICEYLEFIPAYGHTPDASGACEICGVNLNFLYEIVDGEVTILDYIGTDIEVVIPDEIEGFPVTAIGRFAFDFQNVTKVTLPAGLKRIDDYAFEVCFDLAEINLPDGLETIGFRAFGYCSALKEITIPESVWLIGSYAFSGAGLENIYCATETVPEEWEEDWAQDCSATIWLADKKLQWTGTVDGLVYLVKDQQVMIVGYTGDAADVVIPAEIEGLPVTAIDGYAFSDTMVETIVIPDGVTTIRSWAFYNCAALREITIPASVATIDGFILSYCEAMENVYCEAESMPEGWYKWWLPADVNATVWFGGIKSYTQGKYGELLYRIQNGEAAITSYDNGVTGEIVIPAEIDGCPVTAIGEGAFYYSDATSVVIPNTVVSIGDAAFGDCWQLTSLHIPGSVKYIGESVFEYCWNLSILTCDIEEQPETWSELWNEGYYYSAEWGYCAHEQTTVREKAPSCQWEGCYATVCADCGYEFSSEPVSVTGHTYQDGICTVCGSKEQSTLKLGDINGDGMVDAVDYMMLKRFVLGTHVLQSEQQAVADINRDGGIGAVDYMMLKRSVLGTYTIQ